MTLLQKFSPDADPSLSALEKEIAHLEQELSAAETSLNRFTNQIRMELNAQIRRLQELAVLYKQQKQAKKEKRQQQKQKGKNYQPSQNLKTTRNGTGIDLKTGKSQQADIKRLYKEAMVQVHPDKFGNAAEADFEKAHELTVQLSALYQTGDLDALKGFHEHILSGNAMAHVPFEPKSIKDPVALQAFLLQKRKGLLRALQEIKSAELYHVLQTYPDPLTFIPELRRQFETRIETFEKRTRQKKPKP